MDENITHCYRTLGRFLGLAEIATGDLSDRFVENPKLLLDTLKNILDEYNVQVSTEILLPQSQS